MRVLFLAIMPSLLKLARTINSDTKAALRYALLLSRASYNTVHKNMSLLLSKVGGCNDWYIRSCKVGTPIAAKKIIVKDSMTVSSMP